jgi:hypothetical protein
MRTAVAFLLGALVVWVLVFHRTTPDGWCAPDPIARVCVSRPSTPPTVPTTRRTRP